MNNKKQLKKITTTGRKTGRSIRFFYIYIIFLGLFFWTAQPFFVNGADVFAAASSNNIRDLEIKGIRYGASGDKTRLVIDFNAKPDFRAFLLNNPRRLVVDVPKSNWRTAQSKGVTNDIIKGYRSGVLQKEGLTRIIFDMRKPAVVVNAFVIPNNGMSKDRLVIDLKPASDNLFNARTDDLYGNARLTGNQAVASSPPVSELKTLQNKDITQVKPPENKPESSPAIKKDRRYTVVIDAGHGGGDPGAIAFGIKEKNITLAVARELKRQLDETGLYKTVMTRSTDTYIKLHERVDISRRVNADLFVSIHADKVDRNGVRGASIYTLSEKASDAETARLAEDENNAGMVAGVDLREESADVADILLDLAMREKMNESNFLARVVTESFRDENIRLLPNSHRSAGFAVLKAPDVPAVLIEVGFLSNANEAKLLSSSEFQSKIARAIVGGVSAYFRKIKALQKL